jgi:hypothetical protein
MTKRGPSLTLPSAETNTICISIGSPAGIIRVSNRSNRFESVRLLWGICIVCRGTAKRQATGFYYDFW